MAAAHIGVLLHDFRLGGSERVAIRLAREWAARGRRVTLFVGEPVGPLRDLSGPSVCIRVRGRPQAATGRNIRALAGWAAQAALDAGVNAIFLPGNSYFRAIAPLHRRGLPVFTKLSNPLVRPDRSSLRNLLFRAATGWRWRGLRGLVVCSEDEAAAMHTQVSGRVPFTVLANPVLDAMPVTARKVPGQFCAVGRLEPQKNYPLLLAAFAMLRDLPVTLRIAGDGSLRPHLARLAMRLGLAERVQFLGMVPDVLPLMAESEALLLTSDYEGFPAVCVEALAAGTCVIARDGGAGVRQILRAPRTGTLVTVATPDAFARAVRDYWRERRFDAGAARRVAMNHLIGPIAERYLRFLDAAT